MNPDVFLSLLALDSYNRGYGQNVGGLTNSGMIGNATILRQSNITENSDEVQAGFYAIAYQWQGQTVISYRGKRFDLSSGWAYLAKVMEWGDAIIGQGLPLSYSRMAMAAGSGSFHCQNPR